MTRDNTNSYEIPKDLRFRAKDIVLMEGLQCYVRLDTAPLQENLLPPNKLSELGLRLELSIGTNGILAEGSLSGKQQLECSRCLALYPAPVKADFFETFPLNSQFIDIMDKVRQALVLSVEIKQLCSPACKGLCQFCGSDLNKKDCGCRSKQQHGGLFEGLK